MWECLLPLKIFFCMSFNGYITCKKKIKYCCNYDMFLCITAKHQMAGPNKNEYQNV